MSFQIPKEFESPKETMAKLVNFWAEPSLVNDLDTACSINNVLRSEVLRFLVKLFLHDNELQNRVFRGVRNG